MGFPAKREPGTIETDFAPGSGPRAFHFNALLVPDGDLIVAAQEVGGELGVAVTEWTEVALAHTFVGFPITPVALVSMAVPTTATIRLRVSGYDQFGERIIETTPVVNLDAKTNNFVYLSKVFISIDRVQYMSTGLNIEGPDLLDLGIRCDWVRTVDATNSHQHGENLGIGIPMRIGHVPRGNPPVGIRTGFRQDHLGQQLQSAAGTLTLSGNAVAAETVTIDGKVYTWVDDTVADDGEVLVGATAAASLVNLGRAITGGAGSGTLYGAATIPHPTVTATVLTTTTLRVVARRKGRKGNLIAVAETMTNGAWGGGTLGGGKDHGLEVAINANIPGTETVINPLSELIEIGATASGFEGTLEKVRLISATAAAVWLPATVVQMAISGYVMDQR